jgi:hypothetical protein
MFRGRMYILKLASKTYHIEKTFSMNFIKNAISMNYFGETRKNIYKPSEIINIVPNCFNYKENILKLLDMEHSGIKEFRGKTFCQVKLSDKVGKKYIKECYICGKKSGLIGCNDDDNDDDNIVTNMQYAHLAYSLKDNNYDIELDGNNNKLNDNYISNSSSSDYNSYSGGSSSDYDSGGGSCNDNY